MPHACVFIDNAFRCRTSISRAVMINDLVLFCDTFTIMLLFSGWYVGIASAAVFVAGAAVVVLVVIVKYRSRMRR